MLPINVADDETAEPQNRPTWDQLGPPRMFLDNPLPQADPFTDSLASWRNFEIRPLRRYCVANRHYVFLIQIRGANSNEFRLGRTNNIIYILSTYRKYYGYAGLRRLWTGHPAKVAEIKRDLKKIIERTSGQSSRDGEYYWDAVQQKRFGLDKEEARVDPATRPSYIDDDYLPGRA